MSIGYLSNIVGQNGKREGRAFPSGSRNKFEKFIENNGLIDIGFIGKTFTWPNNDVMVEILRKKWIEVCMAVGEFNILGLSSTHSFS